MIGMDRVIKGRHRAHDSSRVKRRRLLSFRQFNFVHVFCVALDMSPASETPRVLACTPCRLRRVKCGHEKPACAVRMPLGLILGSAERPVLRPGRIAMFVSGREEAEADQNGARYGGGSVRLRVGERGRGGAYG